MLKNIELYITLQCKLHSALNRVQYVCVSLREGAHKNLLPYMA